MAHLCFRASSRLRLCRMTPITMIQGSQYWSFHHLCASCMPTGFIVAFNCALASDLRHAGGAGLGRVALSRHVRRMSTLGGALVMLMIHWGQNDQSDRASAAVSGLMAAADPDHVWRSIAPTAICLPANCCGNRRALIFMAVWLGDHAHHRVAAWRAGACRADRRSPGRRISAVLLGLIGFYVVMPRSHEFAVGVPCLCEHHVILCYKATEGRENGVRSMIRRANPQRQGPCGHHRDGRTRSRPSPELWPKSASARSSSSTPRPHRRNRVGARHRACDRPRRRQGARLAGEFEFMTSDVRTCAPDDTEAELMALMTEHRIRHLPVVESGRLARHDLDRRRGQIPHRGDRARSRRDEELHRLCRLDRSLTRAASMRARYRAWRDRRHRGRRRSLLPPCRNRKGRGPACAA